MPGLFSYLMGYTKSSFGISRDLDIFSMQKVHQLRGKSSRPPNVRRIQPRSEYYLHASILPRSSSHAIYNAQWDLYVATKTA